MRVEVRPARSLEGVVRAPPSKSYMHRYLACALLADGETRLKCPSVCSDVAATMRACRALGASLVRRGGELRLRRRGALRGAGGVLHCGGSGATLRFFTAISTLAPGITILTGDRSLRRRPIAPLIDSLRQLGAECYAAGLGGAPPIVVFGGSLQGGYASIRGDVSSQFISALLLASVGGRRPSTIEVEGPLESRGYVEMTLRVLREFGAKVDVAGGLEAFEVEAPQSLRPIVKEEVPGDYSAASFLAVAGAIVEGSRVRIEGLLEGDVQPDRMVVDVLREAGAKVSVGPSYLEVEGPSRLSSFKFDARDSPDLVPPLLALACFCDGESVIEGASRLRFKESDRLRSLPTELSRLGADVRVEGGRIVVRGGAVRGGVARSWSDHRVAMALAVVGLRAERGVVVEGFEAVSKSYPGFAQDLARLGASINVVG